MRSLEVRSHDHVVEVNVMSPDAPRGTGGPK